MMPQPTTPTRARSLTPPPAGHARTASSERSTALERTPVHVVLLDDQPLDADPQRSGQDTVVPDRAVADRAVLTAAARAQVLDVDERGASLEALEQRDRIGTCVPHPAEVELEPELLGRQLAQQVERRDAVLERLELAPVVVEPELQSELAAPAARPR